MREAVLVWNQEHGTFHLGDREVVLDKPLDHLCFESLAQRESGLSADEVCRKLNALDGARVIVDDRVLCDAIPTDLKDVTDEAFDGARRDFQAIRVALGARNPIEIHPLASRNASLILREQPDQPPLLTIVAFGSSDTIYFKPTPGEKMDGFHVPRKDFEPAVRMDGWYYRPEFRKLRGQSSAWSCIDSWFELLRSKVRAPREFHSEPGTGRAAWISSEQIGLASSDIVRRRIDKYVTLGPGHLLLLDGDILISLARLQSVKIARYRNDIGPAACAKYISVLRARHGVSIPEPAELMALLRSPEFIDQIRMSLSDRLYVPIYDHHLAAVRLPPEDQARQLSRADGQLYLEIAGLAASLPQDVPRHLVAVAHRLQGGIPQRHAARAPEFVTNTARLKHALMVATDDRHGPILVIGSEEGSVEAVANRLQKEYPDKRISPFPLRDNEIPNDYLEHLGNCRSAYLLTGSTTPLRARNEYSAYRKALRVLGCDHAFVLVHPMEPGRRRFPGRQLVEHVFMDEGEQIRAIEYFPADDEFKGLKALDGFELSPRHRIGYALDETARACRHSAFELLEEPLLELRRLFDHAPQQAPSSVRDGLPAPSTRKIRHPVEIGQDEQGNSFWTFDENLQEQVERFRDRFREERGIVYIQGPTGTGKNLLARAICRQAGQKEPERVAGQLHENLANGQLFGVAKGAFTGADEARVGILETADRDKRPVFLDEANSLSASTQILLLRLLEDGVYARLGEPRAGRKYRGLLIFAANEDLESLVETGRFRHDLLERLGTPLRIAPLADRPADLCLWLEFFFAQHAKDFARPHPRLDREAQRLLENYVWRGNLREMNRMTREITQWAKDRPVSPTDLRTWFGRKVEEKQRSAVGFQAHRGGAGVHSQVPEHLALVEALLQAREPMSKVWSALQEALVRTGQKSAAAKDNNFAAWVKGQKTSALIRQYQEQLPELSRYLDSRKSGLHS